MRRAAWIIFVGVVYLVAMSALGKRLRRNAEFEATLHAPPYRPGTPEWGR